ncbi:hypothetical protein SAMN05421736_11341 [Evansella caseinilytica]|uniref:Sporulation lipoprotein YhcN/YlaJ n=1 Tax=Evansella caseinilytica TaxID=1503961 RepID=A0A1H3T763_9BACI|nr:hypothetical protein [Evansella caseinilytica]SDZ45159.1 hypothetical protein SAMN05421736_11341 [Evansella caseinilytica]
MKYALTGLGLLLLFVTGCNNDLDTPEVRGLHSDSNAQVSRDQRDWAESLFGPGPANYGTVDDTEAVDNIGEQNTTGQSFRSPSAPHPNIGEDQDTMERIVHDIPGVSPGMIILVGGQAWVNIMFEENVTDSEQENQVREIERRLIEANPRYSYQVIVNEYR